LRLSNLVAKNKIDALTNDEQITRSEESYE